jgi:hypothetical protein
MGTQAWAGEVIVTTRRLTINKSPACTAPALQTLGWLQGVLKGPNGVDMVQLVTHGVTSFPLPKAYPGATKPPMLIIVYLSHRAGLAQNYS